MYEQGGMGGKDIENIRDNDVIELVQILNNNGMRQAAERIKSTIMYVEAMEHKLDDMIRQVNDMRMELKSYSDLQNRSLGEKIRDGAVQVRDKMIEVARDQLDKAAERLGRLKDALGEVKESFVNGVRDTLSAIKTRGKQGLNSLIGVTHIRQAFASMKKEVDAGIREIGNTIDSLEVLGNELRFAKELKRNALRSFAGKDAKEYKHEKNSLFSIITAAPWKAQKSFYEDIRSFLAKGIDKMEKLAADVAEIENTKVETHNEVEDKKIRDGIGYEFQPAVAEQKQTYQYSDEAFEDYMNRSGMNDKKPVMQKHDILEKKPDIR